MQVTSAILPILNLAKLLLNFAEEKIESIKKVCK